VAWTGSLRLWVEARVDCDASRAAVALATDHSFPPPAGPGHLAGPSLLSDEDAIRPIRLNAAAYQEQGAAIGVGTVIAGRPLHGSRRAELPHRALALRHDGKHLCCGRVCNVDRRQPAVKQAIHPFPSYRALLAPSRQCSLPQPAHFAVKPVYGLRVAFDAVVLGMTTHHGCQIHAHLGDWDVPASPQRVFDFGEFGAQALCRGVPMYDEPLVWPILFVCAGSTARLGQASRRPRWSGAPHSSVASRGRTFPSKTLRAGCT
jgi:hypothetical protein